MAIQVTQLKAGMSFICTLVHNVHPDDCCLGETAVQPIIEMLQFMNVFVSISFQKQRGVQIIYYFQGAYGGSRQRVCCKLPRLQSVLP